MREFSWIREKRLDKIRYLNRRSMVEDVLRTEWITWRKLHTEESVVSFLHYLDEIQLFVEDPTPTKISIYELDFYFHLYTDLRDEDYKICSHHIMPSNIHELKKFLWSIPFIHE